MAGDAPASRPTRSGFVTALGDVVNSTARLASLAGAGELFVSADTAQRARMAGDELERRTVDVRGREQGLEVVVVRPA